MTGVQTCSLPISLKQFGVKIDVENFCIPTVMVILGLLIGITSMILDTFDFQLKNTWCAQIIHFFSVQGASMYLLPLVGIIFITAFLYYYQYLRPEKCSVQINFYEK